METEKWSHVTNKGLFFSDYFFKVYFTGHPVYIFIFPKIIFYRLFPQELFLEKPLWVHISIFLIV